MKTKTSAEFITYLSGLGLGDRDEALQDYLNEVNQSKIYLLTEKMDTENSLSAKEYWYRCGINDAINIIKTDALPISEFGVIQRITDMCDQSLDPETHDKWEDVKKLLFSNRKNLN